MSWFLVPLQRDESVPLPPLGTLEQGNASCGSLWSLTITSRECPGCCLQAEFQWDTQAEVGSLGLIPCTNSRTFPRAGSGLLVTGRGGGGGHLTTAFWVHIPSGATPFPP